MHPRTVREHCRTLMLSGLSAVAVAHLTGVPRSTVADWRRPLVTDTAPDHSQSCCAGAPAVHQAESYLYLLGLYLGDGTVNRAKRTFVLRVYCANAWPGLIRLCAEAMATVSSGSTVWLNPTPGCVAVTASWPHWPCLFPQHGPGRKHERVIALEPWQRTLVEDDPRPFLRGLFHSDGCRSINTIHRRLLSGTRTYRYPRYLFANESEDILRLCEWALDLVGVAHRRNRPNSVSVARREAVAVLDTFIGPKH